MRTSGQSYDLPRLQIKPVERAIPSLSMTRPLYARGRTSTESIQAALRFIQTTLGGEAKIGIFESDRSII